MSEALEQAQLLLAKAEDDAFMMRELMKNPDSPSWGIGFHAQQAVEKAIKAVLASREIAFPFTHDLKLLLNLLAGGGIAPPPDEQGVLSLLPYGALLRYEPLGEGDGQGLLDRERTEGIVDGVLAWAESAVTGKGGEA
jgi:hypothetical protein